MTSWNVGGALSGIWAAPPASHLHLFVDNRGLETEPATAARLHLVADVLTRLVEVLRLGHVKMASLELSGGKRDEEAALTRALFIREPLVQADPPAHTPVEAEGQGHVGLTIVPWGHSAPRARPDQLLLVGRVTWPDHAAALTELVDSRMTDPLALRLALLRFPPIRPATLTHARLNRADETLQRWRFKIAGWAYMPPAPAPPKPTAFALQQLTIDLDTRSVLTALHRVETDPQTPSGAKFAIFSSLDRVMGLDLCRLVGKHRP